MAQNNINNIAHLRIILSMGINYIRKLNYKFITNNFSSDYYIFVIYIFYQSKKYLPILYYTYNNIIQSV